MFYLTFRYLSKPLQEHLYSSAFVLEVFAHLLVRWYNRGANKISFWVLLDQRICRTFWKRHYSIISVCRLNILRVNAARLQVRNHEQDSF